MGIGPAPIDEANERLMRRLARHRMLARLVLSFERTWPAIWPPLGLAGLFLIAALLDLPAHLPPWAHVALLAAFALAELALIVRAVRAVRAPTPVELDRRLEHASGLRHRPLAVLTDRPAQTGSAASGEDTLWRAHVARAAADVGRLRVGLPRPGLAMRDPRALRAAVVLGLVAAVVIAGPDAPLRLARAVSPGFTPPTPPPPTQLQAWITPPPYTRLAPTFLKPDGGPVTVPAGAHLTVNITGGEGMPSMALADAPISFRGLDAASFQADQDVTSGGRLALRRQGHEIAAWELTVVADVPPVVAFTEPPGKARGTSRLPQTRIPWEVSHAYGVASLRAELRLKDRPGAAPVIVNIPLPGGTPRQAKGARLQELTANPWAGLPVIARLVARDEPGLTGTSEPAEFLLPERRFDNPMAKALLEVRKGLSRDPDDRARAIRNLEMLTPLADFWRNDNGAFLNFRSIIAQLTHDKDAGAVAAVQARLWLLALHLEEGAPEQTERALEAARQDLRDAMEAQQRGEKIDPTELDKKMRAVEDALQKHLQALAEQARRDPDSQQTDPADRQLDARDMQRLAEQMREAAREGRMDDARQKMAELEKMLEELRNAHPDHNRMTERQRQRAEKRQRGQQQMSALQDMVQREGALLDNAEGRGDPDRARRFAPPPYDRFRPNLGQPFPPSPLPSQPLVLQRPPPAPPNQSADQQPPPSNAPSPSDAQRGSEQKTQQALRRALGELMQEYGDLTGQIPDNLGEADTAMREAGQALAGGRDPAAASAEQRAIEALQKGGRSMSMQMAQQFGQSGEEGDDEGEQEGLDSQTGPGQDGTQPGGREYGRDDGRGNRPWDRGHGADRRADERRDPLGRPLREGTSGADESGDVQVPEKAEEARTRAIQDELRRRDADKARPQPELDYIERLLKRF
jgi:uncharacterized protein (TIGR02302 family)